MLELIFATRYTMWRLFDEFISVFLSTTPLNTCVANIGFHCWHSYSLHRLGVASNANAGFNILSTFVPALDASCSIDLMLHPQYLIRMCTRVFQLVITRVARFGMYCGKVGFLQFVGYLECLSGCVDSIFGHLDILSRCANILTDYIICLAVYIVTFAVWTVFL